MPGPRGEAEKSKDFGKAIKRLFKELKNFKVLAIMSILLATISSVVSIAVPNILSNLTDEITKGLSMP
ncbi:ABC transporter ATP-binding protein, partial [Candidatus Saccharibacteria bacterium]|nr:ABC transporter ATP-binding protein [Candidatus Saccharibacteria bacterium]